jgi:two-component system chemotaxis sensor kinase CheA
MDNPNPDNRGEFFDQFLDDYYAECDEHLISIRRSLVTLEDEVDAGTLDRTVLDNLFRSFHTLKGISGMVGLSAAEQLAHHLESYLRELREGTVLLSESGFEALSVGVSLLEGVINARRNDQPIPMRLNQSRARSKQHHNLKHHRAMLLRSSGWSSSHQPRNLPSAALT